MSEKYERLNEEIEKRGIKQKQLIDLLDINRQSLYCKLNGKRNARFTVEQAIIKAISDNGYEITINLFKTGEKNHE